MAALGFRWKLFLAMTLVVAVVTTAALWVTQRTVQSVYGRLFREQFRTAARLFSAVQEARLGAVNQRCRELAKSVRLLAALQEHEPELLYKIAFDELRDVLTSDAGRDAAGAASFFRVLDAGGAVIEPPDARAGLTGEGRDWEASLSAAYQAMSGEDVQGFGYVAVPSAAKGGELEEVVITRVRDPVGARTIGVLALGFPMPEASGEARDPLGGLLSGIWFDGRLYAQTIPEDARAAVTEALSAAIGGGERGEVTIHVGETPYRGLFTALGRNRGFRPAFQVCLYSLAEALAEAARLRRQVLALGALAILFAVALSLGISRGLSGPIGELSDATAEIRRGNYGARVVVRSQDEVGRLGGSFNEMAAGLELKERYRRVLDLVTDREVAEELLAGRFALGGEVRQATVLFCDIRGFTAFTESMPPAAVIAFLNEHMSALTGVIREHHGVVDKFVGDLVMAIFGAPKSYGADAENAVRAAWGMVAARAALNRSTATSLEVGIGIASGAVVAGCMGSTDRLDYTVLGERVNLGSRLCSAAGAMEVLIDDETRSRLPPAFRVEAAAALDLKGFSRVVQAFRLVGVDGDVV